MRANLETIIHCCSPKESPAENVFLDYFKSSFSCPKNDAIFY